MREANVRWLITRVADVYGVNMSKPADQSFAPARHVWEHSGSALRLVGRLREGHTLPAPADVHRSPTYAWDYAQRVCELVALRQEGVVHTAGPDSMHRWEYLRLLARAFACDPELVQEGGLAAYLEACGENPRLPLPPNTALDDEQARAALGHHAVDVEAGLGQMKRPAETRAGPGLERGCRSPPDRARADRRSRARAARRRGRLRRTTTTRRGGGAWSVAPTRWSSRGARARWRRWCAGATRTTWRSSPAAAARAWSAARSPWSRRARVAAVAAVAGAPISVAGGDGGCGRRSGCRRRRGVLAGAHERVRELEPGLWRMHPEAGVSTRDVQRLARENGLFFAPDPGASEQSQIGGQRRDQRRRPARAEVRRHRERG